MGVAQSHQPLQTLLLGLDGAGKTSVVARLVGDEVRTVLPTRGFSIKAVSIDGDRVLKLWDLGGRRDVRVYWPAYYSKAQAVIFVIDSTDRHRLAETATTLQELLDEEELLGLPMLILANKQDSAAAIPAGEIEELMHLGSIRDRVWSCIPCSALRGAGIAEGLKWLSDAHSEAKLASSRAGRPSIKRSAATPKDGGATVVRRKRRGSGDRSPRASQPAAAPAASGRGAAPSDAGSDD